MSYETLKENLRGVAVTPATPFTEDGSEVDYDALRENIAHLDDEGIPVAIPCGNTGEYYSLTDEERVRIVEATAEAFDGSVVAGAAGSTKSITDLIDRFEDVGADGIMLMHPSHTFMHEAGLEAYFERIADATDLGLVLYKRGEEVTDEMIARLSHRENVVAVKYAVNDIKGFSAAVEMTEGDIVFSNGIAERFAPSFAIEGAEGFTSGIGNFAPRLPLALMAAIRDGDWARARRMRDVARPFEDLREEPGRGNFISAANNVPAVKFALELAGLNGGPVREPIVDLADEDRERARKYYHDIREFLAEATA